MRGTSTASTISRITTPATIAMIAPVDTGDPPSLAWGRRQAYPLAPSAIGQSVDPLSTRLAGVVRSRRGAEKSLVSSTRAFDGRSAGASAPGRTIVFRDAGAGRAQPPPP